MGSQLRVVWGCAVSNAHSAPEGREGKEELTQQTKPGLHFHAEGAAAFSWSALVCSELFKGLQGSGGATTSSVPKNHYQALQKHFKIPSAGGVCGTFVSLRSEVWDINMSYWRAARAAESWALWRTLFGCQWRIIWLHLSWESNPLFLGTLNSWSYLLSYLIFSMGNCDLYLGHWLLYLSQLSSYLCCAYFKLKLYRQIKIFGFTKMERRVVGGKITIF